jgi:hypothetical protein
MSELPLILIVDDDALATRGACATADDAAVGFLKRTIDGGPSYAPDHGRKTPGPEPGNH